MTPGDGVEDEPGQGELPENLVRRLALQKARDVAQRCAAGIIIGCDTVAECHGEILGKPLDRADAKRMLALLAGHEHRVYSGLCLWRRPGDQFRVEIDVTRLIMEKLPDETIEQYLNSGQWAGKAGAFGYQDGLDWVHILAGSESNVVGLPMELLQRMLKEFHHPTPQ
jgi:septum formation protein